MISIEHLNLTLKRFNLEHAKMLFDLIDGNRSYLRKHLGWLDKTVNVQDAEYFINGCMDGYEKNSSLILGIWHDNQMIGVVGFHEIDFVNQDSSMGYWLSEAFQGQGIMTASVEAMINHAVFVYGLSKITIRAAVDNPSSQKIPEHLGFERVNCRIGGEVLYGRAVDQYVYQLNADDWGSRPTMGLSLSK